MRSWPLMLLFACGGETPRSPASGTTAPTTAGDYTPLPDEQMVLDLLAGTRSLDEVLADVAWSGGWPVETARGTYFFVHVDPEPSWRIRGDHDDWAGAPMTPAEGFSWAEIAIEDPAGSGYKFEGPPGYVADPWARSYGWDAYGELSYVRPPGDAPRLDRWPGLEAEGLSARDLRVRVPPGNGPWPVLYAQDGQNLFAPDAIWGGWRLGDALASRADILVVGIDNTADRMDEYTHTTDIPFDEVVGGAGERYARLVGDHIRPHVEHVYGSTGRDGLIGSSLGGLASLYIAEQQPGQWDFVAGMSSTLGWGRLALENAVMDELWSQVPPDGLVLYLDSGGDAGEDGVCTDPDGDGYPADDPDALDNYCTTRQFVDARAEQGWSWGVDLHHWHEPGAPHNEAAWAERVGMPLDLFTNLE